MKVGVNLLNFGPAAGPETFLRWSSIVENLGYHLLMISDHVAVTPDVAAHYPAPFYDPFVVLSWLAGRTRTLELGTTVVILPYRHPLQVARMAANLDQLSGGRFILGVGVGWAREEFAALGVPFEQRGPISDDYLAAIKAHWTSEVSSYHGPFVAFDDVSTGPAPVRQPHPPIWVGGNGDPARRRAVRFGAAWHPIGFRMDWLTKTGLPGLRQSAEEAGQPLPPFCPRIRLHLTDAPLDDATRPAGSGSLRQVHADLEQLAAFGAEYVLLDTYRDDPRETRNHQRAWSMLTTIAERVVDLERQVLR